MDGEDETPDCLRYNGEGKKNLCINWEHSEDSFEASNRKISKFRSKICTTIAQSTTQAKPIDLSWTANSQFRALSLRHKSDVHSRSGANQRKKRKSSALVAAVQPTPKQDSVPQHLRKTGQ